MCSEEDTVRMFTEGGKRRDQEREQLEICGGLY